MIAPLLFAPGSHILSDEGSSIAIKSDIGGMLPALVRPEWLNVLRLCVRYELPERIVIPSHMPCIIEFDRVVHASWGVAGIYGEQVGRVITIPAFENGGLGFFTVDNQERSLVVSHFLEGISDHVDDLLAPFRFDGARCACAESVKFGYTKKPSGHFFDGVGSSHAVTINGVSNVPLLMNMGDVHTISVERIETDGDIAIASSPKMDSASVIARLGIGDFSVGGSLSAGRRMWYGREGHPYSGGIVRIRSNSTFGENWSSGLGAPPPASVSIDAPSAGDYCIINLASMHSWCCATLEVRRTTSSGRPYPTVCSGLARFDGYRWLPSVDISRGELAARMSQSAQRGCKLCLIEPGVMDGGARAGNQLVSFCRDFADRFSRAGFVSFVGVMPEGLSDSNLDALAGNLTMASANTRPGASLAVFIAPAAGEQSFAALRELASGHHRNVCALVLNADSLAVADKFGVNLLVPEDLAPMVSIQAGRQVSVFDANALSRTN